MENKLQELVKTYSEGIEKIRAGRALVEKTEGENQQTRKALAKIKQEIYTIVKPEIAAGKTLYRVCIDQFGIIDKRFHILLGIFQKSGDIKKNKRKHE